MQQDCRTPTPTSSAFDTVASLGSYRLSAAMFGGAIALILLLSWLLSILLPFWAAFWLLTAVAPAGAGIWYVVSHLRYATGLKDYSFWQTLHFTSPKMKFSDPHLDNEVRYAQHALSSDENRADFAIVKWGGKSNKGPPRKETDPDWLQQIWFAGNHSDIGGSYLENESRLSDISLEWMTHAAVNPPDETGPTGHGIKINPLLLQVRPDPLGPQHDEREPPWLWIFRWPKGLKFTCCMRLCRIKRPHGPDRRSPRPSAYTPAAADTPRRHSVSIERPERLLRFASAALSTALSRARALALFDVWIPGRCPGDPSSPEEDVVKIAKN
jgi:hypothetical protein